MNPSDSVWMLWSRGAPELGSRSLDLLRSGYRPKTARTRHFSQNAIPSPFPRKPSKFCPHRRAAPGLLSRRGWLGVGVQLSFHRPPGHEGEYGPYGNQGWTRD